MRFSVGADLRGHVGVDRGERVGGQAQQRDGGALQRQVARIGDRGLLKMSVKRAVEFVHAAAVGHVLSQIRVPPGERDPQLSAVTRENAIAAIATDGSRKPAPADLPGRAVALREALHSNTNGALTMGEKAMMAEWLDRLADQTDT